MMRRQQDVVVCHSLQLTQADHSPDTPITISSYQFGRRRAADRIVVLEAGRVAETSTHDTLRTANGRNADLWTAWSATSSPAELDAAR